MSNQNSIGEIFYDAQSIDSISYFNLDKDIIPLPSPCRFFKSVTNKTNEDWDKLDEDIKEWYVSGCQLMREKYIEQKKVELINHPNTPSNWNGPYHLKCIKTNIYDQTRRAIIFKDFDEAIDAANKNIECNGITLTTKGYSLRKGKKDDFRFLEIQQPHETQMTSDNQTWTYGSQIMTWIKKK